VFFGRHVDTDPAAFRAQMAKLLDWCAEGKIRPHVDGVFSLDETKDAIKALDARTIKGKVVVRP
jgi:NADPH2:quinone reductase